MKLTNIILACGCSLIILGIASGYFPFKEDKPAPATPISHERDCAIQVLYHEARNTTLKERHAVLDVVINRTKHKHYPDTICEVVQQHKQFSYLNNFKANARIIPEIENMPDMDRQAYLEIEEIVDNRLFSGKVISNVVLPANALHYHTKESNPWWKKSKRKVLVKGLDIRFKHKYYLSKI